jgi:hypothetical protein
MKRVFLLFLFPISLASSFITSCNKEVVVDPVPPPDQKWGITYMNHISTYTFNLDIESKVNSTLYRGKVNGGPYRERTFAEGNSPGSPPPDSLPTRMWLDESDFTDNIYIDNRSNIEDDWGTYPHSINMGIFMSGGWHGHYNFINVSSPWRSTGFDTLFPNNLGEFGFAKQYGQNWIIVIFAEDISKYITLRNWPGHDAAAEMNFWVTNCIFHELIHRAYAYWHTNNEQSYNAHFGTYCDGDPRSIDGCAIRPLGHHWVISNCPKPLEPDNLMLCNHHHQSFILYPF